MVLLLQAKITKTYKTNYNFKKELKNILLTSFGYYLLAMLTFVLH